MSKFAIPAVVLLTMLASSCGGGSQFSPHQLDAQSSRQLVSITVTPATADAQDFPNGEVQFSATGHFSDGTSSPIQVMWSANPPFTSVADSFGLTAKGVGQCFDGGIEGNKTVFATAPADPKLPLSQMTVFTKNVTGTAQLTCP